VHASSCSPQFQPHSGTSAEKCQAGQQRHGGWHVTAGSAVQEVASPIDTTCRVARRVSARSDSVSIYKRCIAVTATSEPQLPRPAVLLRCLRGSDLMCVLDPDRVLHDRCGSAARRQRLLRVRYPPHLLGGSRAHRAASLLAPSHRRANDNWAADERHGHGCRYGCDEKQRKLEDI